MAAITTGSGGTFVLDGKAYPVGYRVERYVDQGVIISANRHEDRPGAGTFLTTGNVTINGTLATTVSQMISLLTPVVTNGEPYDEWPCDFGDLHGGLASIVVTPSPIVIPDNAAHGTVVGTFDVDGVSIVGSSPFAIVGRELRVDLSLLWTDGTTLEWTDGNPLTLGALPVGVIGLTVDSPSRARTTFVVQVLTPSFVLDLGDNVVLEIDDNLILEIA